MHIFLVSVLVKRSAEFQLEMWCMILATLVALNFTPVTGVSGYTDLARRKAQFQLGIFSSLLI